MIQAEDNLESIEGEIQRIGFLEMEKLRLLQLTTGIKKGDEIPFLSDRAESLRKEIEDLRKSITTPPAVSPTYRYSCPIGSSGMKALPAKSRNKRERGVQSLTLSVARSQRALSKRFESGSLSSLDSLLAYYKDNVMGYIDDTTNQDSSSNIILSEAEPAPFISNTVTTRNDGSNSIITSDKYRIIEFTTVGVDWNSFGSVDNTHNTHNTNNSNTSYSILNESILPPRRLTIIPENKQLSVEYIQDFCFPRGVPIDFVPLEKAMMLANNDSFDITHVMRFSDAKGKSMYASCITIHVYMKPTTLIMKYRMMKLALMKLAANIIKQAIQRYLQYRSGYPFDARRGRLVKNLSSQNSINIVTTTPRRMMGNNNGLIRNMSKNSYSAHSLSIRKNNSYGHNLSNSSMNNNGNNSAIKKQSFRIRNAVASPRIATNFVTSSIVPPSSSSSSSHGMIIPTTTNKSSSHHLLTSSSSTTHLITNISSQRIVSTSTNTSYISEPPHTHTTDRDKYHDQYRDDRTLSDIGSSIHDFEQQNNDENNINNNLKQKKKKSYGKLFRKGKGIAKFASRMVNFAKGAVLTQTTNSGSGIMNKKSNNDFYEESPLYQTPNTMNNNSMYSSSSYHNTNTIHSDLGVPTNHNTRTNTSSSMDINYLKRTSKSMLTGGGNKARIGIDNSIFEEGQSGQSGQFGQFGLYSAQLPTDTRGRRLLDRLGFNSTFTIFDEDELLLSNLDCNLTTIDELTDRVVMDRVVMDRVVKDGVVKDGVDTDRVVMNSIKGDKAPLNEDSYVVLSRKAFCIITKEPVDAICLQALKAIIRMEREQIKNNISNKISDNVENNTNNDGNVIINNDMNINNDDNCIHNVNEYRKQFLWQLDQYLTHYVFNRDFLDRKSMSVLPFLSTSQYINPPSFLSSSSSSSSSSNSRIIGEDKQTIRRGRNVVIPLCITIPGYTEDFVIDPTTLPSTQVVGSE